MTDQSTLQKALFTIKKLKHLLQEKQTQSEPIAIIGLSCRYPCRQFRKSAGHY
jgi:hypothetical protein